MKFVLGVDDPEMRRIEEVLKEQGCSFTYATKDGRRVHPGNAYNADSLTFEISPQVVFVECNLAILGNAQIIRVDHHREGDPGYGRPFSEFWQASSIGQIYDLLRITEIPHDDLVLAAMDHCPPVAIRGGCPGVSKEEVLHRKITEIANGTKCTPDKVWRRVIDYSSLIETAPDVNIGGNIKDLRSEYLGEGYSLNLLTAQVAALADGYPVLLYHRDAVGKPEKWSISGHCTPQMVNTFMQEWGPASGLTNIYGVPNRGYAGGYVQGGKP